MKSSIRVSALVLGILAVSVVPAASFGQDLPKAKVKAGYQVPRLSDGRPELDAVALVQPAPERLPVPALPAGRDPGSGAPVAATECGHCHPAHPGPGEHASC